MGELKLEEMKKALEDGQVLLPVGYRGEDGVVHRVAKLGYMTGKTEEAIADPKIRENAGKIITALLASVVEEIGTLPRVKKDIIQRLPIADRMFLVVENRKHSLGSEVEYTDTCPECRMKNTVRINLNDLEATYIGDDGEVEMKGELPIGYKDRGGKIHKEIVVRIPTGVAQERMAQVFRSNPSSAVTSMLQLCTVKLGELDFVNPEVFREMTKKDRDYIAGLIDTFKAGYNLNNEVQCVGCGSEFTTSLDLIHLMGE